MTLSSSGYGLRKADGETRMGVGKPLPELRPEISNMVSIQPVH
jgi:hypothetical protein